MVRHGQEERTWWSRNWGWVVGCGCLLVVGLPAACTALVGVLGYGYFRSATPVNETLARVRSDPRVVEALGEPIEWSLFSQPGAEIRVDDDRAEVDLRLSGPRGSGSVHALADRRRDGSPPRVSGSMPAGWVPP